MEWVASQPEPPPRNRTSTTRLANFLNPLRKSSSSRDLQQASAGYIAYGNPASNISTPLQSSTHSFPSPHTTYGFTSNKARLGRAFAEGSGKTKDDSAFYIPYKGPISPPSAHVATFANNPDTDRRLIERCQYLPLDSNGRLATIRQNQKPPVHDAFYIRDPTNASAVKGEKIVSKSLPVAAHHGGGLASTGQSVANRSIGYQSYLPSSMRFDKSDREERLSTQATGAGQLRSHAFTHRPIVTSTVPPAILSVNSRTFPSVDAKSASITSSEGNASSIVHEDSASTSMTSLRGDQTNNSSKMRYSHDGPPLSASNRQKIRTNTASLGSIKAKAKVDEKIDAITRLSAAAHDKDTSLAGASRSPAASPRLPVLLREEAVQTDGVEASHQKEEKYSKQHPKHDLQEAKEQYAALQKIYEKEAKVRLPDQSGWLEPNSNCEKILLPKPSLRTSKRDVHGGEIEQGPRQDEEEAAAFERYRSSKAHKSSPQIMQSDRAQEVLSRMASKEESRSNNGTPLFHHRMPPPIPDDNKNESRQSSRPDIPPRRSSQSRKRRTVQSRAQSRSTTAPKVSFQDNEIDVLDLATVLAQGKALEEERARWREQYRKSVGRARSTGTITPEQKRELAELRRVRYGEEAPSDMPTDQSRQGRSTVGDANAVRRSRSSPDLKRSQFEWYSEKGSVQEASSACLDLHMSSPFQSRTTPKAKGKHLRRRSQSSGNLSAPFNCLPRLCRRSRSSTLLPTGRDKMGGNAAPPMPLAKTSEDTQVITRQSAHTEARTSPGIGEGPYKYKYPNSPNPDQDTFGVAFSAPRPNIGQINAPVDPTFFAGRHETKYDYPRLTSPHSSISGRPAAIRTDSLGMSQVRESLDERKQSILSPPMDAFDPATRSLPVPPRGRRNSHTNPTSNIPKQEKDYFVPPKQVQRLQSNAFYTPADDLLSPGAFYTPPLAPVLNLPLPTTQSDRAEGPREKSEKEYQGTSDSSRGHRSLDHGTLASSDDGSYSPRSIAAKELWNTDEHPEEAFTGLFFRRPGVFLERDRSMSDATVKPGSDSTSRKYSRHLNVDEVSSRKSKDSMYRSSLHGKRDSREIEKMVGSYIDSISNDGSFDDALQREPAWNDSTTNVYRQYSLRIGRVGDHRPEVQPAYQHDTDTLDVGHEESIGSTSTRGRQGSFAASLIMATDSPEQQQHHQQGQFESNEKEGEPRMSDVSLANMVRDYIWPNPPIEGGGH